MVKPNGVQRESDGVVVPVIGVQHDAPGGKGPDFGHADQVGKREGGGVFSPLLANIYLHAFDQEVRRRDLGVLVRYVPTTS